MTDIPPRVRKKIIRDQMAWLRYYEHLKKCHQRKVERLDECIEHTKKRIEEIKLWKS